MTSLSFTSKPIKGCQICGHRSLKSIIFLGYVPPVNTMPLIGSVPVEEPAYPLELLRCPKCALVQIGLEVNPSLLFPPEYPYLSGSTRILRENFADLCREATGLLGLQSDDLIMDIGSNDGTLLSNFKNAGHPVLGVEPSRAALVARKNGIRSLMNFFDASLARRIKKTVGAPKLITAANVFAHIGDIHSVVKGIAGLIGTEGVFVSENHYLLGLVETVQYDTIYHEHLRYYSLRSLSHLLESHGLEIFHVKRIPTHGGSIRVYSARKGTRVRTGAVKELLALEKKAGLDSGKAFEIFRMNVIQSKIELLALLATLKAKGADIYGIGAPSRASTLITYTGIDDGLVSTVVEVAGSNKIGKYMPGTRIPVLDEALLYKNQPPYALLLSWHIARELVANLKKRGYRGKFICPLPRPVIL